MNNNTPSPPFSASGITFGSSAGAFTLGGGSVLLNGTISDNSAAAQSITLPLLLDGGTSNINVTAVLAIVTLGTVILAGVKELGAAGYVKNIVPHLDVPPVMKAFLWPLMFVIEVAGLLIKHVVLAVRLFANMLAGHIVLAVILGFILQAGGIFVYLVTPASIAGVVALSLLELFVAFLQAYIFTFLASLFMGMALHPASEG